MREDPGNETDWSAITRSGVALVLLIGAIVGWKWWQQRKAAPEQSSKRPPQMAPAALPPPAVGQYKHLSSMRPLVIGEKARTEDETRHHLQEWLEKAYQVDGFTPELTLL